MYQSRLTVLLFQVLIVVASAKSQSILSPTGYNRIGTEYWASGGAGIAERGVGTTAFENPALISFISPTVTLEFGWRPETRLDDAPYDKTFLLPSYASIGIPLVSGMIELGYILPYKDHYDGGSGMFPYDGSPNSPLKLVEFNFTGIIQTAFVAISHSFQENTSVGIAAGLDFVRSNDNGFNQQEAKGTRMQFSVGGVTRLFEIASVGFAAHVSTDRYLHYTIRSAFDGHIYSAAAIASWGSLPSYPAKSPPGAEIGTAVKIAQWLTLLGSVEYQNWNTSGNYMIDRLQYHAGAVASFLPNISFRAGWFTMVSPYPLGRYYDNQYFLTGGVSWKAFESLNVTIAYQTSALLTREVLFIRRPSNEIYSQDSFSQQVLSAGVSYSL